MEVDLIEKQLANRAAKDLLLQVMHDRRWKAGQLAEVMGRSPDLVRRWLRNERRLQLEDVIKLAQLGDYSLDVQFGLKPESEDPTVDELQLELQKAVERGMNMWAGRFMDFIGGGPGGGMRMDGGGIVQMQQQPPAQRQQNPTERANESLRALLEERKERRRRQA